MTDNAPPPPPGWYPNAEGRQQWWGEFGWEERFNDPEPPPQPIAVEPGPTAADEAGLAPDVSAPSTSTSAAARRKWLLPAVVGIVALAIGFGAGAAVFSGSSDKTAEATKDPSGTGTVEVTETPSEDSTPTLTDEGDSGGLQLKLISVKRQPSITYTGNTISDLTPEGNAKTIRATGGGYYLVVSTNGKNGTKEPIDLTCGYPIDIAAYDKGEAKYSPIDGLDQIAGNPGCNNEIQPGQGFKESFIFLMPGDAKPDRLEWASVNSNSDEAEIAAIDISKG